MALLDPVVIAQLGKLQIRPRRRLEGSFAGRHQTRHRGTSKEFSEHRPYIVGDDLKSLDWKILGKTDRLVVKQYDEETSLTGILVIDDSASMGFSLEGRPSKLTYACAQAAALGYLLVTQGDATGLMVSKSFISPVAKPETYDYLIKILEDLPAHGQWNPADLFGRLETNLRRRSLVVVFSDLMAKIETLRSELGRLVHLGHDVVVVQVLDPAEKDLPYDGNIEFTDLETGQKIRTDPAAIREAYRAYVQEQINQAALSFRGAGMDFLSLTTDTPFEKGLGAYLSWREAHG